MPYGNPMGIPGGGCPAEKTGMPGGGGGMDILGGGGPYALAPVRKPGGGPGIPGMPIGACCCCCGGCPYAPGGGGGIPGNGGATPPPKEPREGGGGGGIKVLPAGSMALFFRACAASNRSA